MTNQRKPRKPRPTEQVKAWNASEKGKAATRRYLEKVNADPELRAARKAAMAAKYQRSKGKVYAREVAKVGYIAALRSVGCRMCGLHEQPETITIPAADADSLPTEVPNPEFIGTRLEWHHLDPAKKLYDVSQMRSCSYALIDAEAAKCVVLCRSCHRSLHMVLRDAEKAKRRSGSIEAG